MKPEEMLKYATEYDISPRELNWLESPYQKIEHVTKFEFPKNTAVYLVLRRANLSKMVIKYGY